MIFKNMSKAKYLSFFSLMLLISPLLVQAASDVTWSDEAIKRTARGNDCFDHSHNSCKKDNDVCCKVLKELRECCAKIDKLDACDKEVTPIFAKDIPFVADKPGCYCLAEDVIFDPQPTSYASPTVQAAITIKSSNVQLDLGCHKLSQRVPANPKDQVPYVIGILIPDADPNPVDPNNPKLYQSVYITGNEGIISDFSMFGIRVFAHTYDIRIEGLTVKNIGNLASLALRPDPTYFPHSSPAPFPFTVSGIFIGETRDFGAGPLFFTQKANPQNRVSEIYLQNVSCLNNFFNGLSIYNSSNITIDNCRVNESFSDDPGTQGLPFPPPPTFPSHLALFPIGTKIGIGGADDASQPGTFNVKITDSTFNNTTYRGDFTTPLFFALFAVQGFSDQYTRGILCENCQFNGSTSTFVGGVVVNYGSARTEDSTYINCSFDGARGISGVEGLHRSGSLPGNPTKSSTDSTFINCTANDNQQIGNLQKPFPVITGGAVANGFHIDFAKNVTFIGCIANDNTINGPADIAVAIPTATNSNAAGFVFTDNSSTAGAPDAFTENVVLQDCVAMRNMTLNGGTAQGFLFIPRENPLSIQILRSYIVESCVASGNNALIPGTGIPAWSATTPYTTGAVVLSGGLVYTATAANQNVQPPLAPWVLGPAQGVGNGFAVYQNPNQDPAQATSWPISFINCQALHNKGAISAAIPTTVASNGFLYSAGFYLLKAQRHALTECEAIDNIYGIFLQQCNRCTIRNCRSDNNADFTTSTGEGFTDVGTPNVPAGKAGTPVSPGQSTSLFEGNHAYMNGMSGGSVIPPIPPVHVGTNGNYNVFVNPTATTPLWTLQGDVSASTLSFENPKLPETSVHNVSIIN